MSWRTEAVSTVSDEYSVTIPAVIRRELGLEAGDTLRWRIDAGGNLSVEHVEQRYGAFSELDPVETDEPSHAADDHDNVAGDY